MIILSYESTCSVVGGDCVKQGTVYVVVGTAGAGKDLQTYTPYEWYVLITFYFSLWEVYAAWQFECDSVLIFHCRSLSQQSDVYGYQKMVANHTHMTVKLVTVS